MTPPVVLIEQQRNSDAYSAESNSGRGRNKSQFGMRPFTLIVIGIALASIIILGATDSTLVNGQKEKYKAKQNYQERTRFQK